MKRWFPLLVIAAAVAGVLLEPTQTVVGRLKGDAFVAGRSSSYWQSKLASDDPVAREHSLEQLLKGGPEAVPVLRQILRRSELAEVRCTAAELLGKHGGQARDSAPDLLHALQDTDSHVQSVAAAALPEVETPAEQAVPALARLLQSQPSVPVERALSKYGSAASPALDRLVEILRDKSLDSEVRWNAARTLGKMKEAGAPSIPALVASLTDEAPTVREHAAEALGDIGPLARHTVPELRKRLNDSYFKVRRDAVRSIGQTGVDATDVAAVIAEIEPLLTDAESIVRDAAAKTLETLKKTP